MASVNDDFLRVDAGTLGANWTRVSTGDIGIVSNQAKFNSGAVGFLQSVYSGVTWTANHYAQVKLITLASTKDMGCVVRGGGTSDATVTGYLFVVNDNDAAVTLGSSIRCGIYKINGTSSVTLLGSNFTLTLNANDVIYLEIVGSTLIAKVNGTTQQTTSDGTFTTGSPGIYMSSSGNTCTLDDFSAADIATVAGTGGNFRRAAGRPFPFKPMGDAFRPGPYKVWH